MTEQKFHEMILEMVHPLEVEEWVCPTCGRRFLLKWPPAYLRVVLEAGDATAIHSGKRNGIPMIPMPVPASNSEGISLEDDLIPSEEAALRPWMEWMERVNFEALWDRTLEE